jgi:CxxC-x17-CxxC domain-containing protein
LDDDKKKADDAVVEPVEEPEEPAEKSAEPEEPKDEPAKEPEEQAAPQSAPAAASGTTDKFGRTLYDAVCSQCGKTAQVPFQPTADRPVYCQDCYRAKKPKRDFGGDDRRF